MFGGTHPRNHRVLADHGFPRTSLFRAGSRVLLELRKEPVETLNQLRVGSGGLIAFKFVFYALQLVECCFPLIPGF